MVIDFLQISSYPPAAMLKIFQKIVTIWRIRANIIKSPCTDTEKCYICRHRKVSYYGKIEQNRSTGGKLP